MMPTSNPRITITLPPHHHEVLSRLAAASGDSMSSIVAGFVELAIPSLERVVVVMERARAAPEEVRSGLAAAFERADRDLMPALEAAAKQSDLFFGQVVADTEGVTPGGDAERPPKGGRRRGGAISGGSTPVPVTRGSGLAGRARKGGARG